MKMNAGPVDRSARIMLGLIFVALGFYFQTWLGYGLGAIALTTGLLGYCPLYTVVGLNTCPIKK